MLLVLAGSIAIAILAPWLRMWNDVQWARFAAAMVAAVVGVALTGLLIVRQRKAAAKRRLTAIERAGVLQYSVSQWTFVVFPRMRLSQSGGCWMMAGAVLLGATIIVSVINDEPSSARGY
jgi:hypothetical protein